MDKGVTVAKWVLNADSLAEITPNAPEFIAQFVCLSPKFMDFNEKKASFGVRSPCSIQCICYI